MTTPWRSLPAGRELDAVVAEKVMGWEVCRSPECMGCNAAVVIDEDGHTNTLHPEKRVPWFPSTDIAAAWEVVERMVSGDFATGQVMGCMDLRHHDAPQNGVWGDGGHWWNCAFLSPTLAAVLMTAPTAPLAICRAALAATEALGPPGEAEEA